MPGCQNKAERGRVVHECHAKGQGWTFMSERVRENVKYNLWCRTRLSPRGWSGLWWAGTPAQEHTARRVRYRSSFPSRSGRRWQSVGWEGLRVPRRGLWPGTDTPGASAAGFGRWSPSAAAGPPPRTDPGIPILGAYGRSPVSQRGRSAVTRVGYFPGSKRHNRNLKSDQKSHQDSIKWPNNRQKSIFGPYFSLSEWWVVSSLYLWLSNWKLCMFLPNNPRNLTY